MATFFDRLPYDILPLIFDCLDIKTLLDAALASHVLNEIASLSLYTSITFNQDAEHGMWYARSNDNEKRKNPILALHRRPHLRKVVRSVVLCSMSINPWSLLFLMFCKLPAHGHLVTRMRRMRCFATRKCSACPMSNSLQLNVTRWIPSVNCSPSFSQSLGICKSLT